MKDLVSVVVTCYNHEKYIEECLKSILSQTYQNLELIVINDGSTDDSEKIIQNVLLDSPFNRTEYIYQDNSGICVARNLGLEWIEGEFVLFVDSDNYLDANYIAEMLKTATTQNADIVYTNLVDPETQEVFMEAKEFDLTTYLASNYIDNCSLIRTNVIGEAKYDLELNRKKLVDYDFIMQLILANHAKPKKCTMTQLNYRVLQESISRQNNHGTEKFYYEIYLYILGKYIIKQPILILEAIRDNIFILVDRLDDLINHLQEVTQLIEGKEEVIQRLIHEIEQKRKQFDQEKNVLNLEKQSMEIHTQNLESIISDMENEKQMILQSKSYRIGNLIIKPASYGIRLLKNPRLIRKVMNKGREKTKHLLNRTPKPQKVFLKAFRSFERKKNNYLNPKRALIYVIYENQDYLQEYKIIFLKALAKIVDEVLIVVNGELQESDLKVLNQYGHVETRENTGYDTAAFRYGIHFLGDKLKDFDELLLINDTNVGPVADLDYTFKKMADQKLDFWGISYGEEQNDFTTYNKYGIIPVHLQSYFLVIEKSLLTYPGFYQYWENLDDTDSREKAIGKHETVFTKHFSDLGFKHGALTENNTDSPMYIHPLTMVKEGIPLIKYTAFANYHNDKFAWQGLLRETEVPALLDYIRDETDYPMEVINQIMYDVQHKKVKQHILIIDGVENVLPQLTKYRVQNKVEQLKKAGFDVWCVNLSNFEMGYAENASHIIIYRASYTPKLGELVKLAKKYHKPVLYDIDDLVIDTKYTDQLTYVQNLSEQEKNNYDSGVIGYGKMLKLCTGAIASTNKLSEELLQYQSLVLINRNLANDELIKISKDTMHLYGEDQTKIKIGYFSGSISHNENFDLIKPAILKILEKYSDTELHLVGHLDIPKEFTAFKNQIITHPFVDWQELPKLISQVDINLAPLVDSIFNQAKSEIKWLEAALVKVPTLASNLGAFKEMILDNDTGVLVKDSEWFDKLEQMILDPFMRERIANSAHEFVMNHCTTDHEDELTEYLMRKN